MTARMTPEKRGAGSKAVNGTAEAFSKIVQHTVLFHTAIFREKNTPIHRLIQKYKIEIKAHKKLKYNYLFEN
jgi:hypothetical protein